MSHHIVEVRNLHHVYPDGTTALRDVSFRITHGESVGIIGANGVGKTTLLRLILGELTPQSGTVQLGTRREVIYFDQLRDQLDMNATVIENVGEGNDTVTVGGKQRHVIGYLQDFLFSPERARTPVHILSGGERNRLLLAKLFTKPANLLVMDEPTNGLDIETIGWLENFLADYENIVLVVSHDRHFLDSVCTHVADVDRSKIKVFTGNYTFWYESSQLMARQINDKNKKVEEKRQALLDFIARFSANASKSKQATARKKALEKLTIEEIEPSNRKYPGIIFQPLREVGNQILNVENLKQSVDGRPLFDKVSFSINKGEKIAFLSKDPLAVTQFFEIINGNITAENGKYEWGTTITKAYLPLENSEFFKEGLSLMDWLRQFVPSHVTDADEPFLRGFLGKMLFSGDDIGKKTNVLSGGEKVRCMVSRMMLQSPNLIVLDQPTNHLDLESIQAFNEGCQIFPGVVMLTSHDHTFMQTVANRIIELTPKGIIDRLMTFDEYMEDKRVQELRAEYYS